jgi:hypothetical protein
MPRPLSPILEDGIPTRSFRQPSDIYAESAYHAGHVLAIREVTLLRTEHCKRRWTQAA